MGNTKSKAKRRFEIWYFAGVMKQKSQRHEFLEMQALVYEHATKGVVASIFSGPVSENFDIYGIMQELLCPEHIFIFFAVEIPNFVCGCILG